MFYTYLAVFVIAVSACAYAIRKTIFIAIKKHLFDEPTEERKIHIVKTPNLGGVAIFSAFVFTMTIMASYYKPSAFHGALIAGAIIIFFVGLTDDLSAISPIKKLGGQFSAALLVCLISDLRVKTFSGFLGVYELPYLLSICLSVFFIVFVINAYNLMDGVNWLAGTTTLVGTITFSYLFYQAENMEYFIASIALSGCLFSFLFFNKTPARIFMGDSGSLFLGYCISIFSLQFLQAFEAKTNSVLTPTNTLMIVLSIIAIPSLDMVRVFGLRIMKRKSPFEADKNHFHHLLLSKGFSHLQIAAINSFTIAPLILLTILNKGSVYASLALIISIPVALVILANQLKPDFAKSLEKRPDNTIDTGKLVVMPPKHEIFPEILDNEIKRPTSTTKKIISHKLLNEILEEPA